MSKIIKMPLVQTKEDKINMILKKYNDIIDDSFNNELEEMSFEYVRFDKERLKIFLLIEKLLQESTKGTYNTRRGMGNVFQGMCTTGFRGKSFKVVDISMFKDAIMLSSCCEIYPQFDGNLMVGFSSKNMDLKINWDEKVKMLLEGDF